MDNVASTSRRSCVSSMMISNSDIEKYDHDGREKHNSAVIILDTTATQSEVQLVRQMSNCAEFIQTHNLLVVVVVEHYDIFASVESSLLFQAPQQPRRHLIVLVVVFECSDCAAMSQFRSTIDIILQMFCTNLKPQTECEYSLCLSNLLHGQLRNLSSRPRQFILCSIIKAATLVRRNKRQLSVCLCWCFYFASSSQISSQLMEKFAHKQTNNRRQTTNTRAACDDGCYCCCCCCS